MYTIDIHHKGDENPTKYMVLRKIGAGQTKEGLPF